MKRHIGIALCLAGASVAAISVFALAQHPSESNTGGALASIKELMESVVDPSADEIWNSVGTIVDKDEGIKEMVPQTPEEWAAVRRATVRIIEAGNLLTMPGRLAAPPGTKSETPGVELEPEEMTALINGKRSTFDSFAKALQAIGVELERAADAKDAQAILDTGARMEDVCESCHQTFWYPPKR